MKRVCSLTLLTILIFFGNLFASYYDDNLTQKQAQRFISSVLFNISLISIDDPELGANYFYNNWGVSSGSTCNGYQGGHAGVDMQTKDVAGNSTANREFYSLTNGEVITSGGGDYNTIAVYDSNSSKTTIYLHARSVNVNIGDFVNIGYLLGIQGDTGSYGSEHVHVEVREGKKTGPACGANTTIDPINYLYDNIRDILERRIASCVLPPLMRSSNTYRTCNNQIHIEFELLTYSPAADLKFLVNLYDSSFSSIVKYSIPDSSVSNMGSGGFVLHTGGVSQNIVHVSFDTSNLANSQLNDLKPNMYYRVFVKNKNTQLTIPTVRNFNWNTYFTLFIPKIIETNMRSSNVPYTGSNQNYAQRYISVNTNNCY